MYAIIDIETSGGKFNEEGITEIAIYKFDGEQVVDQFISLINPERLIDPFVVQLTGITVFGGQEFLGAQRRECFRRRTRLPHVVQSRSTPG